MSPPTKPLGTKKTRQGKRAVGPKKTVPKRRAEAADHRAIPSWLTPKEEKAALALTRAGTPHPGLGPKEIERIARAFDAFDATTVSLAARPGTAQVDLQRWNGGAALVLRGAILRVSRDVFGAHVDPDLDVRGPSLADVCASAAEAWRLPADEGFPIDDVRLPRIASWCGDARRRKAGLVGFAGEVDGAERSAIDFAVTHEEQVRDALAAAVGGAAILRFAYVHGVERDGLSYCAFDFRRPGTLDGVSVTLHGARVVHVGAHVDAWTWSRSRADAAGPAAVDAGPDLQTYPAWSLEPSDDGVELSADLDVPAERDAIAHLHAHAADVERAIVDAVLAFLGEDDPELERDALVEGLRVQRICTEVAAGVAHVVLWLEATWETEEGMTIALRGDRVVAVGFGPAAFDALRQEK